MFGYILIILGVVLMLKNFNTYFNEIKIINAIYEYHTDCIDKDIDSVVEYEMMRGYFSALFRLWDWNYKNSLPTNKFEIIKPYININKEDKNDI